MINSIFNLFLLLMLSCSSSEVQNEGSEDGDSNIESTVPDTKNVNAKTEFQDLSVGLKTKNEDKVLNSTSKLLSVKSDDVKTLNALGVNYLQLKKYGLARLIFTRALKKGDNSATLHNNLGLTYHYQGDKESAVDEYKKALQIKKSHREANYNLALYDLENMNFKSALGHLEFVVDGDIYNKEIAANYALALLATKDFNRAEEVFNKFKASATGYFPLIYNHALFFIYKKNKNEALKIMNKLENLAESEKEKSKLNSLKESLKNL